MKFFLIGLLASSFALASSNDLTHRPKSFSTSNGKAVFADFTEAVYKITYDVTEKKASVQALIKFNLPEAGLPIFDSVSVPTSIELDGIKVSVIETQTPSNETSLRMINKNTKEGGHELMISVPLTELVEFTGTGVKSAFWTSDLSSREFLELYMPANFEFDQVKMTFIVKYIGATSKHVIYTNGVTESLGDWTYKISYPEYYTASSIFFHTVPEGSTNELRFSLKSVDGRDVPAVVYTAKSAWGGGKDLEALKSETAEVFHELEGDYGAFPHPSITVYNAGSGGMEYCGATMTSRSALGHELFHSYFARGMMPANGNSGWLDEAFASWRDEGYQTLTTLSGSSMMSGHPYYTRTTDRDAYSFGERFMRYMDGRVKAKGGLKPFMRRVIDQRVFQPLFVEEFIKEMGEFYGTSFESDFKKFTYGPKNFDIGISKSLSNKHHQKMTLKELREHL